jgi:ferritin
MDTTSIKHKFDSTKGCFKENMSEDKNVISTLNDIPELTVDQNFQRIYY